MEEDHGIPMKRKKSTEFAEEEVSAGGFATELSSGVVRDDVSDENDGPMSPSCIERQPSSEEVDRWGQSPPILSDRVSKGGQLRITDLTNILPVFIFDTDEDQITCLKVSLFGRRLAAKPLTNQSQMTVDFQPDLFGQSDQLKLSDSTDSVVDHCTKAKHVEQVAAKLSHRLDSD